MQCRRVSSLLSAYLDGELVSKEIDWVRAHLDGCGTCFKEYQTLRATKELVAGLALKAPREDLEALLSVKSTGHGWGKNGLLRRAAFFLFDGPPPAVPITTAILKPRPLAATALLSLAGLWMASASVDKSAVGEPAASGIFVEGVPGVVSTSEIAPVGFRAAMTGGFLASRFAAPPVTPAGNLTVVSAPSPSPFAAWTAGRCQRHNGNLNGQNRVNTVGELPMKRVFLQRENAAFSPSAPR